jgi:divalent metal cation (Fe/Co/Zn/Cd) transporter
VDPEISVEAGHSIAREVKTTMCEKHPEISKVLVHVEPALREHIMNRCISGKDPSAKKSTNDWEI